jgi:hypothetical protein
MRQAIAILFLAGCGGAGTPPPTDPIVVTPTQYDAKAMMQAELADGAAVDLIYPPQGGFVLFVGAIATNVDPAQSTLQLLGRILDPGGNEIARDTRTVTLTQSGTEWVPDLRSYINVSNIAICPSSSTTDRYNQPFTLEVMLTEPTGRSGKGSRAVTLECRQTDPKQLALCQCECAANYSLGKCTQ